MQKVALYDDQEKESSSFLFFEKKNIPWLVDTSRKREKRNVDSTDSTAR